MDRHDEIKSTATTTPAPSFGSDEDTDDGEWCADDDEFYADFSRKDEDEEDHSCVLTEIMVYIYIDVILVPAWLGHGLMLMRFHHHPSHGHR